MQMKNRSWRLSCIPLWLAAALLLAACREDAGAGAAPVSTSTDQVTTEGFQQSLEGVWSTSDREGDDAQTLYAIEWLPGSGLRVVRDGTWLDGQVEDVDLDNGTLALYLASENGPSETVTVRKVPDADTEGAFTLRVTWGSGQSEALGFVRRLTGRDRSGIAEAIAADKTHKEGVACETTAPDGSVRAVLVCGNEEFAALDAGMRAQFAELADRYPDGDRAVAAATRQLDGCATPACLREAYAQWQAYFDENYDLGDVLDYR